MDKSLFTFSARPAALRLTSGFVRLFSQVVPYLEPSLSGSLGTFLLAAFQHASIFLLVHCTLQTAHCKLHTANCTLQTAHLTLTNQTAGCRIAEKHVSVSVEEAQYTAVGLTLLAAMEVHYTVHCTLYTVHCMLYTRVRWFLGPTMNFYAHKDFWAGQPYIRCSIYSFHLAPRWTCAPLQHLCEKSIM